MNKKYCYVCEKAMTNTTNRPSHSDAHKKCLIELENELERGHENIICEICEYIKPKNTSKKMRFNRYHYLCKECAGKNKHLVW